MAKYTINDTTLFAIANAIREKSGTTGGIDPENMAALIAAIEAGGGGSFLPFSNIWYGSFVLAESSNTFDTLCGYNGSDHYIFGVIPQRGLSVGKGYMSGFSAVYAGKNRSARGMVENNETFNVSFSPDTTNGTFGVTLPYPFMAGTEYYWILGVLTP